MLLLLHFIDLRCIIKPLSTSHKTELFVIEVKIKKKGYIRRSRRRALAEMGVDYFDKVAPWMFTYKAYSDTEFKISKVMAREVANFIDVYVR